MARILAEVFRRSLVGDRSGIRVVAVDGAPVEAGAGDQAPMDDP